MESGKGGARRERGKRARLWPVYVLLLAICGLLIGVVASLHRPAAPPVTLPDIGSESLRANEPPVALPERSDPRARSATDPAARRPPPAPTTVAPTTFVRPPARGTLFFVIDDVGNNVEELRPFLSIPGPLTLSVLPQLAATKESYDLIVGSGKMAMLHLPMQALGEVNPGPGAIYTGMSEAVVAATISRDLEGLDRITWVNNHEGSKVTGDAATMTFVLSYLKQRGLAFLDSVTTPDSQVPEVAARLSLPYFKRNSLFLDNVVDREKILAMIDSGLSVAQREGYAVMIGHVWDADLAALLANLYPKLTASGFVLADLSALPEVEARRERARN